MSNTPDPYRDLALLLGTSRKAAKMATLARAYSGGEIRVGLMVGQYPAKDIDWSKYEMGPRKLRDGL